MWTVVPHVSNIFAASHIQSWIFDWTYLRCCWRYADICMPVILQILCQIQSPSSGLRYVNCGPGHIQCICSSAYSDFKVHLNVSVLLLEISRQFNSRYTANLVPNTAHILRFTLCELWSRTYTKCCISAYSGFNIQLNVSATLLDTSRQVSARYTANLEPYTAHILQFILCGLWSRPYTMKWQHRIFSLQYSTERICAAIGIISTIQWELYCNLGAKYRASTRFRLCHLWSRTYTI
jgi:hypothetical protein